MRPDWAEIHAPDLPHKGVPRSRPLAQKISSCRKGSMPPRSDMNLPCDEIDAGDHFGHRMLDLEPRVHFEEIKPAIIGRQQELHCAGSHIADGTRGGEGRLPHGFGSAHWRGLARALPR